MLVVVTFDDGGGGRRLEGVVEDDDGEGYSRTAGAAVSVLEPLFGSVALSVVIIVVVVVVARVIPRFFFEEGWHDACSVSIISCLYQSLQNTHTDKHIQHLLPMEIGCSRENEEDSFTTSVPKRV